MKRLFDILFASSALLVLSPLLLVIAVLIRLDSPGPVLYTARRCGQHRRPFTFYKFRTMVTEADRMGSRILTTAGDERVTHIGRYLRVFKLDELPQLINVLKGDMSIVGPRPEVFEVVDHYCVDQWDRVLSVRPGLTCLLQIDVFPDFTAEHGGVDDPFRYYVDHQLPYKLQRDREYVEMASPWLDLRIIARTIVCIGVKSWSFLPRGSGVDEGAARSAAERPHGGWRPPAGSDPASDATARRGA
jgi:lipopolysaccharide/colanic/teichoic acid biosynthesis glycosyltransferase